MTSTLVATADTARQDPATKPIATVDSVPETVIPRYSVSLTTGEQPYWVWGDVDATEAKTIIAVHGLRGTHMGLCRIAEELDTKYRVIIPDLPGFGETADLPGSNLVSNYADWLADFVRAIDLPRATVLGHSFGTIIVAAAAPKLETRNLIMINPIAADNLGSASPHPVATRAVGWLYRLASILPEKAGRWVLTNRLHVGGMNASTITTKDSEIKEWIKGQHAAYYNEFRSVTGVVAAFEESASKSVLEYASGIIQNTLLIAAENDSLSTPQGTRDLAEAIPNAELRVIAGVGHLIHYEKPAEAARLIEDFLEPSKVII